MEWAFSNEQPIYMQLLEQLKVSIITGELKLGEKIPSVRDLALESGVNPNTMQKALAELEYTGLIITKRTSGKFVTEDKNLLIKEKNNYIESKISRFILEMRSLKLDNKDLIKYLQEEDGK